MTWIVRVALDRPYTFIVLAIVILIFGPIAAMRTPTDIFPDIGIPVIGVVWNYTGLPPDQMAGRIVTPFQPTGLGAVCASNSDCDSGTCAADGKDSKCSMTCTIDDATSCPSGFDCITAGAGGACWPHSSDDGGGCCSVGGSAQGPIALTGLTLLGLLVMRRRRR